MKSSVFARGFSIPELIIVTAIISLLSAVAYGSYSGYRVKARDSKRVAEIEQVHLALKQYASINGTVPSCTDTGYGGGCDMTSFGSYTGSMDTTLDGQFLQPLVAAGYLPDSIIDPLNDSTHFYIYGHNGEFPPGSGVHYDIILGAILEDENDPILQQDLNEQTDLPNIYLIVDNI